MAYAKTDRVALGKAERLLIDFEKDLSSYQSSLQRFIDLAIRDIQEKLNAQKKALCELKRSISEIQAKLQLCDADLMRDHLHGSGCNSADTLRRSMKRDLERLCARRDACARNIAAVQKYLWRLIQRGRATNQQMNRAVQVGRSMAHVNRSRIGRCKKLLDEYESTRL